MSSEGVSFEGRRFDYSRPLPGRHQNAPEQARSLWGRFPCLASIKCALGLLLLQAGQFFLAKQAIAARDCKGNNNPIASVKARNVSAHFFNNSHEFVA
jgi:hypothetical protein